MPQCVPRVVWLRGAVLQSAPCLHSDFLSRPAAASLVPAVSPDGLWCVSAVCPAWTWSDDQTAHGGPLRPAQPHGCWGDCPLAPCWGGFVFPSAVQLGAQGTRTEQSPNWLWLQQRVQILHLLRGWDPSRDLTQNTRQLDRPSPPPGGCHSSFGFALFLIGNTGDLVDRQLRAALCHCRIQTHR